MSWHIYQYTNSLKFDGRVKIFNLSIKFSLIHLVFQIDKKFNPSITFRLTH